MIHVQALAGSIVVLSGAICLAAGTFAFQRHGDSGAVPMFAGVILMLVGLALTIAGFRRSD